MEAKKIGIELIKKAIKFVYDFTEEGIEILKDKKIVLGEILGLGDNLYSVVTLSLKSTDLWAEIKDIDSVEGEELLLFVGGLVKNATADEIDIIIDNAIAAIQAEIEIYEKNIMPIIEVVRNRK